MFVSSMNLLADESVLEGDSSEIIVKVESVELDVDEEMEFAETFIITDDCPPAGRVYIECEEEFALYSTGPGGALPATEEQIAASQLVPNKIDISLIEQQIINSRSSNASWTYLSGYLVYNQTNNYHCGPAAVQAALGYLLDYEGVPSQNQVATECSISYSGTYLENMKTYINNKQDFNNYISYYGLEQSSMEYFLYAGIVNFDAAPIIGVKPTLEDGWLYTTIGTTGHFVSVYGAKSDKSAFALVDPWIGYSGSGLSGESWSYSMSADVVYDAYDLVNCGLMY